MFRDASTKKKKPHIDQQQNSLLIECALTPISKGTGHFSAGRSKTADRANAHRCAAQDIKWFAALMEIMVQWVGYERDDCSQNNL